MTTTKAVKSWDEMVNCVWCGAAVIPGEVAVVAMGQTHCSEGHAHENIEWTKTWNAKAEAKGIAPRVVEG